MRPTYQHLFFDLDRTLWDFDRNASLMLDELFHAHELASLGIGSAKLFSETYRRVNDEMWDLYRRGEIDETTLRTTRFERALRELGIDDVQLGSRLGAHYLRDSPRMPHLLPGAHSVLTTLSKTFELHIITNGFEEVQHIKLEHSSLKSYFGEIVTSQAAGAKKPDPEIFRHALCRAGADARTSLMIGDDVEVDVLGAKSVGMDGVYFNPNAEPNDHDVTYEIRDLSELVGLLV